MKTQKSRFKVGQQVYMDRGKEMRTLIVKKVIDNPYLPVYQYAFENEEFICGEQSIRRDIDGADLTISECFKGSTYDDDDGDDDGDCQNLNDDIFEQDDVDSYINSVSNGYSTIIDTTIDDISLENVFPNSTLFFKPNFEFCQWLKDYANNRFIIDVGSGQGHLVRMLKNIGVKAMGLEPNIDYKKFMELRAQRGDLTNSVNEILPWTIERAKDFIIGLGAEKTLLIFARPCHSDFVEVGIHNMPKGMEALYITIPENLHLYNDLGAFQKDAVLLEHKGVSEDNEVVYSIVRK